MAKRKSKARQSPRRHWTDLEILQRAAAALPPPPRRDLANLADDAARADEIFTVDRVEQQAWIGWHRSCEKDKPDARYLAQILRCAALRFNLLGIGPRPPRPIEWESPAELHARLQRFSDELQERQRERMDSPAEYVL